MKNKTKIGILYGGKSVEHKISIRSAKNVFHYIDKDLFEVTALGISEKGHWYVTDGVQSDIESGSPLQLALDRSQPTFVATNTGTPLPLDVVFPVLHGTDGEDGSVQGLLKAIHCPCVGSGVLGSSVAMSKTMTKKLLKESGVFINKFKIFQYEDKDSIRYEHLIQALGNEFIIKPANLGSSVGIVKVEKESELPAALEEGFKYDNTIIVEEFIHGRELECAILGNGANAKASLPGEIVLSDAYKFYTFEAKYLDKNAVSIKVPAAIDTKTATTIQEQALLAYHVLECQDFARVDVFLSDENKVYINEINSIPGFTDSSMFPALWKQHGLEFKGLITKIVGLTLERFKSENRLETEFGNELDG